MERKIKEIDGYDLYMLQIANKTMSEILEKIDEDHSSEVVVNDKDDEIKELETFILDMFKAVCLMHENKYNMIKKMDIRFKLFGPMLTILRKRGLIEDDDGYIPCHFGEDYWTKKEEKMDED